MDKETKKFLGRIIGEILRIVQKEQGICCESNETIYGLLNGFEHVLDEVIEMSQRNFKRTSKRSWKGFGYQYFLNKKELTGFYDIENELQKQGVDRGEAIEILTYFKAGGHYEELFPKFDSNNSPTECRTFKPWPDDLDTKKQKKSR